MHICLYHMQPPASKSSDEYFSTLVANTGQAMQCKCKFLGSERGFGTIWVLPQVFKCVQYETVQCARRCTALRVSLMRSCRFKSIGSLTRQKLRKILALNKESFPRQAHFVLGDRSKQEFDFGCLFGYHIQIFKGYNFCISAYESTVKTLSLTRTGILW